MRRKSQARHFNSVETLDSARTTSEKPHNSTKTQVTQIPMLPIRIMNSSRFDYRSSSLTSNSSDTSENEDQHQPSVQTLTECLQRIHRSPEDKTLLEALGLLQLLKKDFLQEMPSPVRSKASQLSRSSSAEKEPEPQIFHLLGRCFNLSINAKILSQCQFSDLAVAVRLLEDLETLETGLKLMSKEPKISFSKLSIS